MTENDRNNRPPPAARSRPARERRLAKARGAPQTIDSRSVGQVGHDDLGNAVWEWRVDVPRRRNDDPTLNLLKCLDVEGLSLEDDGQNKTDTPSFNPYNKRR